LRCQESDHGKWPKPLFRNRLVETVDVLGVPIVDTEPQRRGDPPTVARPGSFHWDYQIFIAGSPNRRQIGNDLEQGTGLRVIRLRCWHLTPEKSGACTRVCWGFPSPLLLICFGLNLSGSNSVPGERALCSHGVQACITSLAN
jgi:hypothetical protein